MHIEIKDLQNGQTFRIDEKGTTIGRDKNRATIAVGESGVSGLHARIATKDNKWWLEDLGSSNGTFIDTDRLAKGTPAQLERGSQFKFHTYKFEVIDIDPDGGGGKTQVFSGDTNVAIKPPSEPVDSHPRTQENVVVQQDPPEEEEEASAPVSAPVKTDNPKVAAKPAPKKVSAAAVMNAGHKGGGGGGGGPSAAPAGSFGAEFGKAIAFYLAAIPKLLFAFKPQVEESIANQKYPPMKGMPLAAWALPPNLLGAIIGSVAGLIVMIVGPGLDVGGWIIGLVKGLAIAVVLSILFGFIYHPFLGWVLKILKAAPEKNNETSRTNWFIITQTSGGLVQIIGGIGVLFGLLAIIPIVGPFVGIIPALLGIVGAAIGIFVAYRWFQWFEVMKWVPILMLVFLGLSVLSGLWGAIGVVRHGIAVAGGSSGSSGSGGVATIDLGGNGNAEAQKAIEEAKAAAEKAIAEAKAAQGKAGKGAKETKEDAKSAKEDAKAAKEDAKTAAAEAKIAAAEAKAAKANGGGGGKDDYESYLRKREAVEQAIEKNPTVLTGIPGVLALYKQLHKDTKLINEKYKKQKGDNVAERIKDAELYDRTVETVSDLHRKILER